MRGLDWVLPPRCPLSGEIVDAQGMIAPESWRDLSLIAPPFCACCGVPFDFETEEGGRCLSCLQDPPAFGRARAALRYDAASRGLILGFKHGDKTHGVVSFLPMLRRAGQEILEQGVVLVPVPLHPLRLLSRRYNQSALIAQSLAQDLNLRHWPLALRRVRATPPQGHLKAPERKKNVHKAFALHPAYAARIKGERVVLVDDVFTTGATAVECTRVLLRAGAASVDILTLARVHHGNKGA